MKRWLVCLLEFNGRHRQVMAPDRDTERFFRDEATALAAGHRPSFECRRKSFERFAAAWAVGYGLDVTDRRPAADSIDEGLHGERVGPGRSKRTYRANIDDLPDGVSVTLGEDVDRSYLLWERHILAWSPGGYADRVRRPLGRDVTVLTPRSTVAAFQAG